MDEFFISIYGQKAVDIGYKFQGNFCYRGIYNHGKRIAQLEVVLDDDGEYNGFKNKWVDVTINNGYSLDEVLKQLRRLGFAGMYCYAEITINNKTVNSAMFEI